MEFSHDIGRSIGVLVGTVTALEQRVSRNEIIQAEGFTALGEKLDDIKVTMAESKGKHSMLTSIGAASIAVMSLGVAIWGKAFGHG
jgi:hypothetical protein